MKTTYGVALGPEEFTTRSPHLAESFSHIGADVTAVTETDP